MPVPSTIADLSTVAADNYPQGSEPIGTSLDNYIRSGFSFIKQLSNEKANLSGALFTGTLGYGPGAGGSVTQATSKSTAVTLNKPCGLITMNAASLAAGESVVFNLVSSCITDAADGVLVHGIWQAVTPASYRIEPVGYVATNTFAIRVTNITGAALAEAVCVGFVVIKGVSG